MPETPHEFSLEAKLQELRTILQQMQGGNLDFDANIKLFTQGTALVKECRTYLDQAEMLVKKLVEGAEEPFAEAEGGA